MEKLLVVTYGPDLPQLEMFLYCLQKNWKGNQFLTIVFGNNTDPCEVENIVNRSTLSEWNIEIHNGSRPEVNGYTEQNLSKIIYSIDQRFQDVIVFDSKDFLLKTMNFETFKFHNRYRTTFYNPNQALVELYPDTQRIFDQDISHVPSILNLTPWIWNVQQLKKYWIYMNNRFGDYQTWHSMPGGNEIDSFFAYTWCDKKSFMLWAHPDDNPLIIGGGWTHQTYEGMLQEAHDFDQWSERKVWKHSRKLDDPRCLDVTRMVLEKHGIDQKIINRVFG
jgi:hypothetical protein